MACPSYWGSSNVARLLTAPNELSIKQQFKRIFTAALAAGVAWFVLEQTDISSLTKAITYGIIGVVSPEVIGGVVKLAKNFEKNPLKFFKK